MAKRRILKKVVKVVGQVARVVCNFRDKAGPEWLALCAAVAKASENGEYDLAEFQDIVSKTDKFTEALRQVVPGAKIVDVTQEDLQEVEVDDEPETPPSVTPEVAEAPPVVPASEEIPPSPPSPTSKPHRKFR